MNKTAFNAQQVTTQLKRGFYHLKSVDCVDQMCGKVLVLLPMKSVSAACWTCLQPIWFVSSFLTGAGLGQKKCGRGVGAGQDRCQDFAAWRPKPQGGPHFLNTVLDIRRNRGPNMKWRAHILKGGTGGHHWPPRWRRPWCVLEMYGVGAGKISQTPTGADKKFHPHRTLL